MTEATDSVEGSGSTALRVLVVDDDAALRQSFCRLLGQAGFSTSAVESGRAAIDVLSREEVDVVLCDVRMPDMDGIELLQEVRHQDANVSVVLISGTPDLDTALKAVQLGATEYLRKPIEAKTLVASLQRAAEITRTKREQLADLTRLRTGRQVRHSMEPLSGSWTGALLGGRYRVGEQIGAGGMGVVYEAKRVDLADKLVAVKIIHRNLRFNDEILKRFQREAEVVARLSHQNIVQVLDYEASDDGPAFLVMERLRGRSLAELELSEGQLSPTRAVFIVAQTLFALEAAHAAGVVHRDLKPENIFLTSISGMDDIVRVLDFGIAKFESQDESLRLTRTGVIMGTPLYLAPEQARGAVVDHRSDLYSLGCIMYEALSGRVVLPASNYNQLLLRIQQDEPEPLGTLRPDLEPVLCDVVHRALAKNPDDRFQSAREMITALEPWLRALGPVRTDAVAGLPHSSGKFTVSDPYRTTRKIRRGN